MTAKNALEDIGVYLQKHPLVFSTILFLTISRTTYYVLLDLGLYFWVSYFLLGLLLGAGSIYFGLSWKKVADGKFYSPIYPLFIVALSVLLPLIAAGVDQIYLNTVLKHTEPISMRIGTMVTKAMWLVAPSGEHYLYRESLGGSDDLWLLAVIYMLVLFLAGILSSKRFKKNDVVAA